jgi:aspartate aminotransferase-like enzyme
MGCIGPEDILTDLQQLEETLCDLGKPVVAGSGTKAAEAVLAR